MTRIVIPFMVSVALLGGYVVGQQLEEQVRSEREGLLPHPIIERQRARDGAGVINDLPPQPTDDPNHSHLELLADLQAPSAPVGRYVPADGGRLLDTTNGTLYGVNGDRWQAAVQPPHSRPAAATLRERAVLLEAAKFLRRYNFSEATAAEAQALAAQLEALLVELP